MDGRDVYPAEMPSHPIPPLDGDTAERLLSGRLDPDDAPPAYADVARLLQAAAALPCPDELPGREAALAMFRAARTGSVGSRRRAVRARSRPVRVRGPTAGVRGRLVAVALAGALVVGGAVAGGAATGGLWTTDGVPSSGRLRSPTGGPGAGGSGSGAPGFASGSGPGSVTESGGSGLLRPAGSSQVTDLDRAIARHGGGGASRGGGAAHGTKPVRAPEAEASTAKVGKAKGSGSEGSRVEGPGAGTAGKPEPKGPKAAPGKGANRAGGKRK